MHKKQSRKSQAGFTLLELLVSVVLILIASVALFSLLRLVMGSWKKTTETVDFNQRYRSISQLIKRQVSTIYGVNLQSGSVFFIGESSAMQFITPNSLEFWQNPGMALIRYKCIRNSKGEYSLVEQEQRIFEFNRLPKTDLQDLIWTKKDQKTLASNFADIYFEYLDPATSLWSKQWSSQKSNPPAAVSITMISTNEKGMKQKKDLIVPIHAKPYNAKLNYFDHFFHEKNGPNTPNETSGSSPEKFGPTPPPYPNQPISPPE